MAAKKVSNIDPDIGALLKRLRLIAGLSQMDVAAKVGVTFQQIQKYEKGANRVSVSRLIALGKALNFKPSEFLLNFEAGDDGKAKAVPSAILSHNEALEEKLKAVRSLSDQLRKIAA